MSFRGFTKSEFWSRTLKKVSTKILAVQMSAIYQLYCISISANVTKVWATIEPYACHKSAPCQPHDKCMSAKGQQRARPTQQSDPNYKGPVFYFSTSSLLVKFMCNHYLKLKPGWKPESERSVSIMQEPNKR